MLLRRQPMNSEDLNKANTSLHNNILVFTQFDVALLVADRLPYLRFYLMGSMQKESKPRDTRFLPVESYIVVFKKLNRFSKHKHCV